MIITPDKTQYLEWKNQLKRDKSMLPMWYSKLCELKELLRRLEKGLDNMYKIRVDYPNDEFDFSLRGLYGRLFDLYIEKMKGKIRKVERDIRKFMWLREMAKGKEMKNELDVERAKAYPIGDLLADRKSSRGHGRVFYLCPLHNEKHNSFVWYKDKNRWHCFGACGTGGDSIDLYMKMTDCEWRDAVRFLQNN